MDAFVSYGYTPFRKGQCIKRGLCLWALSAGVCFIGERRVWSVGLAAGAVCVSVFFAALIVRYSSTKRARFLCDGVFSLYLSLLFNLAAYRLFALETGDSWMMAVGFLLLLFGSILAFLFITFRNIKKGVFSKTPAAKQTALIPAAGGALGILVARFLLTDLPQRSVFLLLGALLLCLSLLMSIPSVNILKAVLCKE